MYCPVSYEMGNYNTQMRLNSRKNCFTTRKKQERTTLEQNIPKLEGALGVIEV